MPITITLTDDGDLLDVISYLTSIRAGFSVAYDAVSATPTTEPDSGDFNMRIEPYSDDWWAIKAERRQRRDRIMRDSFDIVTNVTCRTCGAPQGQNCMTASGKPASMPHTARVRDYDHLDTEPTPTPVDLCRDGHRFQFGHCIYCDVSEVA